MLKKYKILLLSALLLTATVCIGLLAGCKLNKSLDDVIKENNLKFQVTYFLNDGEFEDGSQIKEMYYPSNAKVFNIGVDALTSGNAAVTMRSGYLFLGWYEVELNDDGRPVYTDDTEFVDGKLDPDLDISVTDNKFDFSSRPADGSHIYLCAKWERLPFLTVELVCDGFDGFTSDEVEYNNGDVLVSYPLKNTNDQWVNIDDPDGAPLVSRGYTFVEYFENEECTKVVKWPYSGHEDKTIYAKFIEGNWDIIKDAASVKNMFIGGTGSGNYYFVGDENNEIDCSQITDAKPFGIFMGTIEGNGVTLKNLTLTSNPLSNGEGANSQGAIFGRVESYAVIKDISLSDVNVTFNVMTGGYPTIYCIFTSIKDGAEIENVNVSGSFVVNYGSSNTELTEQNWLFGGYATDGEYLALGKITVGAGTNVTIVRNGQENLTYTYNG